jgi:hypothetical protein
MVTRTVLGGEQFVLQEELKAVLAHQYNGGMYLAYYR